MTSTIKAIQTRYSGCKFRSRLEARWAVFFDAMGYKWEYEPQGYALPTGECYLPDFWLPDYEVFAEVKPDTHEEADAENYYTFIYEIEKAGVLLRGVPALKAYEMMAYCRYTIGRTNQGFCVLDDVDGHGDFDFRPFDEAICMWEHRRGCSYGRESSFSQKYKDAVVAARSARFEHGESGATK